MKVLIKNLTLKEMFKICKRKEQPCDIKTCPFYKYDNCWFISEIEEDLEREVEVDE